MAAEGHRSPIRLAHFGDDMLFRFSHAHAMNSDKSDGCDVRLGVVVIVREAGFGRAITC